METVRSIPARIRGFGYIVAAGLSAGATGYRHGELMAIAETSTDDDQLDRARRRYRRARRVLRRVTRRYAKGDVAWAEARVVDMGFPDL